MPTDQALDIAWVLVCAALVMFMQAGFSSLESGMVRTKNSINVAAKNFTDFLISATVYWLFGFAIMFGLSGGWLLGWDSFAFDPTETDYNGAFFLFQLGFLRYIFVPEFALVLLRGQFEPLLLAAPKAIFTPRFLVAVNIRSHLRHEV